MPIAISLVPPWLHPVLAFFPTPPVLHRLRNPPVFFKFSFLSTKEIWDLILSLPPGRNVSFPCPPPLKIASKTLVFLLSLLGWCAMHVSGPVCFFLDRVKMTLRPLDFQFSFHTFFILAPFRVFSSRPTSDLIYVADHSPVCHDPE